MHARARARVCVCKHTFDAEDALFVPHPLCPVWSFLGEVWLQMLLSPIGVHHMTLLGEDERLR